MLGSAVHGSGEVFIFMGNKYAPVRMVMAVHGKGKEYKIESLGKFPILISTTAWELGSCLGTSTKNINDMQYGRRLIV